MYSSASSLTPNSPKTEALLRVEDLSIFFRTATGEIQATHSAKLLGASRRTTGNCRESGCGKTVTGLSLLGTLPRLILR